MLANVVACEPARLSLARDGAEEEIIPEDRRAEFIGERNCRTVGAEIKRGRGARALRIVLPLGGGRGRRRCKKDESLSGGVLTGWQLRYYILALVVFHSSEFMLAIFYGRCVGVQSLLLTVPYLVALTGGLAEYALESWLVPQFKSSTSIAYLGLVLVVMGEITRKLAIVTAQSNFSHDIKISHEEGHKLVTDGIYRFVRHPSYLGFFIFAIGTQVMLCNPFMTIAYAIVLWRFFADRIEYEEYFLHEFFGQDYEEYAKRTPSGIPFLK